MYCWQKKIARIFVSICAAYDLSDLNKFLMWQLADINKLSINANYILRKHKHSTKIGQLKDQNRVI